MRMAKPQGTILVGCCESCVVEFIRIILAESCDVAERSSFAELLNEALSGGYDAVIVYGNCLTPPYVCEGGLLENATLAIKTIKATRAVSVIALTSMAEWRETLRVAGADVCLGTPFCADEFRDAVSSCLQRRV
jgi:hypothetical protein